jgi:polysaccharide pyruvyl transferase WcaK-like protein
MGHPVMLKSVSKVRRILLVGYYGMANTGDDALLAVSSWGLKQTFSNCMKVYVTTDRIPQFPAQHLIVPLHRMQTIIPMQRKIVESAVSFISNAVVFGGGSVFHSVDQIHRKISLLKLSGNGQHVGVGISLGPFVNKYAEKLCGELLQRLNFLGVRDQESFDIARNLAPGLYCKKTFDLAPLLMKAYNVSRSILTSNIHRRGIGIAMCPYESFITGDTSNEDLRKERLVHVIQQLDSTDVEEVVFIDFNGHSKYGDFSLHRDIISKISNRYRVRHVSYLANPLATLEEISKLRCIIAMRLHAAVFAYIAETPVIMLSYHPKCDGWAQQIRLEEKYVMGSANFDVDELRKHIEDILNGHYEYPRMPFSEAESLSLENFVWSEKDSNVC